MNIRICLNGETLSIPSESTLNDLLIAQDLVGKRIAVEHNGEIAPRSQHANLTLRAGDTIEIVHAIGGG